jgi:hypothetical protein
VGFKYAEFGKDRTDHVPLDHELCLVVDPARSVETFRGMHKTASKPLKSAVSKQMCESTCSVNPAAASARPSAENVLTRIAHGVLCVYSRCTISVPRQH